MPRPDLAPAAPANGPPASALETELPETEALEAARPERDPVSPFCHDVLELFRGPLAEVRFPDLDRPALDRADLDAHEARALAAQREVEALERALEQARARTAEAQAALADRASRALAYARVFASGQPELEARLAAVRAPARAAATPDRASASSSGAVSADAPRKRGRPRKDASLGALLPMAAAHDPAVAVAE